MMDPKGKLKEVLLTKAEISQRVAELGQTLNADYQGKDLLVVGILKGSFIFLADLVRHLDLPLEIDFMAVRSYGDGSYPGELRVVKDLDKPLKGRHILIVEDILDTGQTLFALYKMLDARGAASLKTVAFLDKPSRRMNNFKADYIGYEIPDRFVVGYGLDYAQQYRHLPYVAIIEP